MIRNESDSASSFENIEWMEEMYSQYKLKPDSLDPSWHLLFADWDSLTPAKSCTTAPTEARAIPDARVYHLIQGYREYGHLTAKINPIATHQAEEPKELKIETYGLSPRELSVVFDTCGLMQQDKASLADILDALKAIYCNKIGVEYIGLNSPEMEAWIQRHIEPVRFKRFMTINEKKNILHQLNKAELLEAFLHTKYVGQKRFSIEGGETLIPILSMIIESGASQGIGELVIGMAHRGRLNVLANILNKSYREIFAEFGEGYIPNSFEGSGDVKYHKGFEADYETAHGQKVHIDLSPNPSHLEAVDPVVEGMARARQDSLGLADPQNKVLPLLIHGDGSIAGQGILYETLQLYKLQGYSTGGTVHVVVNNQIGFTTLPQDDRSTFYCTAIAGGFGVPVFHVNAEDPEGCAYVAHLAVALRQRFHCDVFIDMNCYRKYGHNEGDEPAFTQPLEYQIIRNKKSIREIYRNELIQQGVLERQVAETLEKEFKEQLNEALTSSLQPKEPAISNNPHHVRKANPQAHYFCDINTSVEKNLLQELAQSFCSVPQGFHIHPKLQNLLKERLTMVELNGVKPMDWGMAETLAYATLLAQGISVRISGQDCCRGTFSHRHAMWVDQKNASTYFPLQQLTKDQGKFSVYNSPLSEYAVLGFEYGYNEILPKSLVIWEAQFGDFSNGAQIIIDQFLVCGEQKWGLKSSLVLFLPHGYEGQGPEHSSARMERFLSLAGNENMRIINPSTPAQLFHLLRRHMLEPIIKPLIIFTPKGLLRHPDCVNTLKDLTDGAFQEIIDDPQAPESPKTLVLCSGRIYYDLIAARSQRENKDVVFIRIEQLYPLHIEKLQSLIKKYECVEKVYWVQEEPSNMGAWDFLRHQISPLLPPAIELAYIGRRRSASTAVGSHSLHKKQSQKIINTLFNPNDT